MTIQKQYVLAADWTWQVIACYTNSEGYLEGSIQSRRLSTRAGYPAHCFSTPAKTCVASAWTWAGTPVRLRRWRWRWGIQAAGRWRTTGFSWPVDEENGRNAMLWAYHNLANNNGATIKIAHVYHPARDTSAGVTWEMSYWYRQWFFFLIWVIDP